MVISNNPEPSQVEFDALLNNTLSSLVSESKTSEEEYLDLLGKKFEVRVLSHMKEKATGTPFENSIELVSGQKFPDIIANKFYGIEIKTTKRDHWITTGNSVLEGTRIDGVERIYMLFGKMVKPFEFKCRLYQDCLSDVVVTHSPRYKIDMELQKGKTIFDKLGIPYEKLRNAQNPIRPIVDYYRQFLEPGEEVWWMDQEDPISKDLRIKLWNNLDTETRKSYMAKAMVLFPEIFSNRPDKFNKLAVWLVNFESVVCPNIRDIFTAGGRAAIHIDNKVHIPQIISKLLHSLNQIESYLYHYNINMLEYYWQRPVNDKLSDWLDLVEKNTQHMHLSINLKAYIKNLINQNL